MTGGTASTDTIEFLGSQEPRQGYKVKMILPGATEPEILVASGAATYPARTARRLSYLVPVALAATLVTPPAGVHEVGQELLRDTAQTRTIGIAWPSDDEWSYVPELVRHEQVENLNALLGMTSIDDVGFEYFPDDE